MESPKQTIEALQEPLSERIAALEENEAIYIQDLREWAGYPSGANKERLDVSRSIAEASFCGVAEEILFSKMFSPEYNVDEKAGQLATVYKYITDLRIDLFETKFQPDNFDSDDQIEDDDRTIEEACLSHYELPFNFAEILREPGNIQSKIELLRSIYAEEFNRNIGYIIEASGVTKPQQYDYQQNMPDVDEKPSVPMSTRLALDSIATVLAVVSKFKNH